MKKLLSHIPSSLPCPPAPPAAAGFRRNGEEQTRYIGKYYPPPLCFATQNIGEVSRRDGGVK